MAPPVMIASLTAWTMRGSLRMATATLLRGPMHASVISPGADEIFSIRKSTLCSDTGFTLDAGSLAYPTPTAPCVSGASSDGCTSGNAKPRATGMLVARASSSTPSALASACSTEQFPCTTLTPSTVTSGEASASRMARESSIPGSVSNRMRLGAMQSPGGNGTLSEGVV